jgi:hypothetical protein
MINKITQSTLWNHSAQANEPDQDYTDGKHQARNAFGIIRMGCLKIEPIPFHFTIHFFDPHAHLVLADQDSSTGLIGDQVPGFILAFFLMHDQPGPACIVLFSQVHTFYFPGFSLLQAKVNQPDPVLSPPTNLKIAGLPDHKATLLASQPLQQAYRLKPAVIQHPNFAMVGNQRMLIGQQFDLPLEALQWLNNLNLLGTVLWLLSLVSRFVTGIVMQINGGFSAFSGV